MGSQNQVLESFRNAEAAAIPRGAIIRGTTGVRQALLAQADTLAHLASVLGAANNGTGPGGLFFGVSAGEAPVLLETGLTPVGGQTVYVSASVAGRGTTAPPTLAVEVGTIIDASSYSLNGTVTIQLAAFFNDSSTPQPDWDPSLVRYYFLDNELGSDDNVGYIDAAADTVFTPTLTDPVVLKTFEELRARLPRYGYGRAFVVLAKPRSDAGNYVNKAGANDYLDINYDGYRLGSTIRASNLTNDANDKVDNAGEIASVGPNVDGSWTAAGAAAGFSITVAAGTLPAQDTLAGLKLEFKGNVTAAARLQGNVVAARSADTVFDVGISQTIALNDEFFFRSPSLRVTTIVGRPGRNGQDTSSTTLPRGLQIVGFRFTSAITTRWSDVVTMQFFRVDGAFSADFANGAQITTGSGYRNDANTATVTTRCGGDFRGNFNIFSFRDVWLYSAFHGASISIAGSQFVSCGGGCYFNSLINIRDCRDAFFGGFTGTRPAKCTAGLKIDTTTAGLPNANSSSVNLGSVDVDGATNGVTIEGINASVVLGVLTGTCTGTALVLTDTRSSRVYVHSTTTMTGTPDIMLAGTAAMTFAGLAITNVVDNQGNDVQGSAGHVVDTCILVNNQSGGARAIGAVMRSNGTTGQVASAFADALANSGVEGVFVTPPAAAANGYMVAAGTPVANFDAAPTVGAIAYLSVTTPTTLTTTIPPVAATNQKLRIGRVISVSGTTGRVSWHPENLAVTADGNA